MITISDGILTIPEDERFVGFKGDNLHTQKKFFIRTTPESGWLYRLYLTFDDGRHNFFTLPWEAYADGVLLTWDVKEDHILISGYVKAQIKAFSEDNEVYHTTYDLFVAGKATEEDEEFKNSNSEFIHFEKTLNELYKKMETASAKMPYVGTNGNWFTYDVISDGYKDSGQSAAAALEDMIIPPEKLDRRYWEFSKSSFVSTARELLDMLSSEQQIMRIKALKDSPLYSQLGNNEAIALKNSDGFLLFDLDSGKKYKIEPEAGLSEIETLNYGDISTEFLFSDAMREMYLSLPVVKTTAEDFTVEWFNAQTTPGIYQARSSKGEHCVLIVLKPDTQIHLMQLKLSHGKLEYRSCESDVPNYYFADCWTEWVDLTAVADVQQKLKSIEADIENIETRLSNVEIVSWKSVQYIVRSGRAAEIFSVGDKFVCQHEGYGILEWMVIDFDHDIPTDESLSHSMTLELVTPIPAVQFDAPEALFSVNTAIDVGSAFTFTVNGSAVWGIAQLPIPVGALIVFPYYNYSTITETPLYVYNSPYDTEPSHTLQVQAGSGGGNITYWCSTNDSGRAQYGSSNWMQSAMRQFLNSSADAGNVWIPQSSFDRPPKWGNTIAGFLKGMDKDFLSVIGNVQKPTFVTAFDNGTHAVAENTEKFFLPSVVEVFGSDYRTNEMREGEAYRYYSENSSRPSNSISRDTNRIVYYNGKAVCCFLRSANFRSGQEYNHNTCYVTETGGIEYIASCNDYNSGSKDIVVKPCCCIV